MKLSDFMNFLKVKEKIYWKQCVEETKKLLVEFWKQQDQIQEIESWQSISDKAREYDEKWFNF